MARPDSPFSSRALGAALPDFVLGATFLIAWIAPARLGARPIPGLLLVMLLEFIVVHSGGFAGSVMLGEQSRERKTWSLVGMTLFYTLFVGGFALVFKTWWPLVSFWTLMLNRTLGAVLGQATEGDERGFAQRSWAAGGIFYLGFAFLTIFLPLPRLGLTPAVVSAQDLPGEGLWISQPWRVLAFGFLYFTATGLSELNDHRWLAGGVPARQSAAA